MTYDLLGPWAFREVFYSFSGPGGYLSPTVDLLVVLLFDIKFMAIIIVIFY
jgi:hypothetical protein